jgi:hypothetical protein
MAATHQLKKDAGTGLRRNARDPPPHIPVMSKALVRRPADNRDGLN